MSGTRLLPQHTCLRRASATQQRGYAENLHGGGRCRRRRRAAAAAAVAAVAANSNETCQKIQLMPHRLLLHRLEHAACRLLRQTLGPRSGRWTASAAAAPATPRRISRGRKTHVQSNKQHPVNVFNRAEPREVKPVRSTGPGRRAAGRTHKPPPSNTPQIRYINGD